MKQFFNSLVVFSIGSYINLLSFIASNRAKKLAYRFFSNPRKGRLIPSNLPEILRKATFERLTLADHVIPVYVWQGNAHTIILVHGWESNAARWEPLIHLIQKSGWTIIALDGPAHGQASGTEFNVPQYASFIEVAVSHFQPVFMIGHSLGGTACLLHQHLYQPKSIQKIILLGTPSDLEVLLQNFKRLLGLNNKVYSLLTSYFEEKFNVKVAEFSGATMAASLRIPGIIAHDIEDKVVAFEESQKILQQWKAARLLTTTGLGHSMHNEKMYQEIYAYLFEE